jgi:RHS repeat-associated protein
VGVPIRNTADYSPFGVQLDGRTITMDSYRYGFQNQEKDDEIKGVGNSVNYKYRMHDPRVGRFFAVDPLASEYPHNGTYNFSENRVLDGLELEGLEVYLLNGYLGFCAGDASQQKMESYWRDAFVEKVTEHFNENKVVFVDGHLNDYVGGPLSLVQSRVTKGYVETYERLKSGEMKLSNDVPVTIIGHSQGNAYGVGMARAIVDFQNNYNNKNLSKPSLNVAINFVALAVFQGDYLSDELKPLDNYSKFNFIQFTYTNDIYQCRPTSCQWDANSLSNLSAKDSNGEELGALGAHMAVINQNEAFDKIIELDKENDVFITKGEKK